MRLRLFFILLTLAIGVSSFWSERLSLRAVEAVTGDSTIQGEYAGSRIILTTTSRLAGAFHSMTWNGKEFIDSFDHGRQLQSAASFDCGRSGEFWAECFNPTEAGSRSDGVGPTSTSKLIRLKTSETELESTSKMAFWLKPGEKSEGRSALNTSILSQHQLSKKVRIGYRQFENVINYQVTFTVPGDEQHKYAQFEALTGYMPFDFSQFFRFIPESGKLESLDDGPGEQRYPVVFATINGSHAMAVYSPEQPSRGYENAGYGRFRFPRERVVKWNCVFRERQPNGINPGDYHFQVFVIIGTQTDVRTTLIQLVREFQKL